MQIGSSSQLHQYSLPSGPTSGHEPANRGTLVNGSDYGADSSAHEASGRVSDKAGDKAVPASGKTAAESPDEASKPAGQPEGQQAAEERLAEEQVAVIRDMKARDREVRQHEAAHKAVGGSLAGAVSYTYQRGPDGVAYAVGGEVPIDISPAENPEATLQKMDIVKAAAMAPAQPSPQDLQVVAAATQTKVQAQAELASEEQNPGGKADAEAGADKPANEDNGAEPEGAREAQESGGAKRAASAYQSMNDFMAGLRPGNAAFEARA